ncbi:hypothetical protein KKF04_05540 [Patescibacteria group bacterium]|nr:hypothetical protein [Patescibacteria group bacterium]MBU1935492.1 hypothetical protein [Patescibacteria group bacterium]
MLINFFLAILLIAIAIGAMMMLDTATSLGIKIVKSILRFTRRSKILTEYILRAYIRYRKTINKQIA